MARTRRHTLRTTKRRNGNLPLRRILLLLRLPLHRQRPQHPPQHRQPHPQQQPTLTTMTPFLLADNQDVTRAGLKYYIDQHFADATPIDTLSQPQLQSLLNSHPNAIVIIDYTNFDIPSIPALINLQQRFPLSQWLIFSPELTLDAITLLAAQGDISIILKDNSQEEILTALQCATRHQRFLCHQISNQLLQPHPNHPSTTPLTPSEIEVLKLIAKGKSVKEIATLRHSSAHTIITHKKNIFRKIQVNNTYEATKYALHAGLVDLVEYYI